mgnify:CR=1 FL=1
MNDETQRYEFNSKRLYTRTLEEEAELVRVERDAIARFSGQLDDLEAALGMLRLGHHIRTIRKYEQILGINVREFFPAEGPSHERSVGYSIAKKVGNFWKAVSGAIKIEDRRLISDDAS